MNMISDSAVQFGVRIVCVCVSTKCVMDDIRGCAWGVSNKDRSKEKPSAGDGTRQYWIFLTHTVCMTRYVHGASILHVDRVAVGSQSKDYFFCHDFNTVLNVGA